MANPQIQKEPRKAAATKKAKKVKDRQEVKVTDSNIGEGDRSSDRRYRDDVRQFIETDNPEKRARDAQSAIERDPAQFADAEKKGKARVAEEDPEVSEVIDGTFEETDDADADRYKH